MKTLSVFVDESGDFGAYQPHSPYYIFTLVFHDQGNSIEHPIDLLEKDYLISDCQRIIAFTLVLLSEGKKTTFLFQ